jgi:hypothetical protein
VSEESGVCASASLCSSFNSTRISVAILWAYSERPKISIATRVRGMKATHANAVRRQTFPSSVGKRAENGLSRFDVVAGR